MIAKKPDPPIKKGTRRDNPLPTIPETPVITKVHLPQTKNPRDLERQRADVAWQNIQAVKTQSYEGKYGSLARKMPTLIQINGLAQTLAFLKSKGKEHHNEAFNHLSNWFCSRFNWNSDTDLLNQVIHMDSPIYRLATNEALAFLQWLKRFAEAELTSED
jgi:CRISPR-associated protein Cmr5